MITNKQWIYARMRNDEKIGCSLFESINRFYMSDNLYHQYHGGIDESKQDFVKRVFGGKINTVKTIVEKITNESIKENRWSLPNHDKSRLAEMDNLIKEHYQTMLEYSM